MDKHKAEAEDEYHSMYRSILNAEQSRANMKSEITTLTQKINKLSVTKAHLEGLTSCASSIFNTANTGLQSLGITKGLNRSVKHRSSGRSIQNAQQAQDLPGLVQVLSEDYVTPTLQSFGETLADLLSCSKKHRGDPMSLYSALDVTLDIFDKMSYWKNFNRTVLKTYLLTTGVDSSLLADKFNVVQRAYFKKVEARMSSMECSMQEAMDNLDESGETPLDVQLNDEIKDHLKGLVTREIANSNESTSAAEPSKSRHQKSTTPIIADTFKAYIAEADPEDFALISQSVEQRRGRGNSGRGGGGGGGRGNGGGRGAGGSSLKQLTYYQIRPGVEASVPSANVEGEYGSSKPLIGIRYSAGTAFENYKAYRSSNHGDGKYSPCPTCGMFGHKSRGCLQLKCKRCGKYDHSVGTCPN